MSRCAFSMAFAASASPDRCGAEDAARGHAAIEKRKPLQNFLVLASDDLGDLVDPVDRVARIDALRTVAEPEVAATLQT